MGTETVLSEHLKRRLQQAASAPGGGPDHGGAEQGLVRTRALPVRASAVLADCFPEGRDCSTAFGTVFACEVNLGEVCAGASTLSGRFLAAFDRAKQAPDRALPAFLEPLKASQPAAAALIDTETAGFHGRPLFLIGLVRYREGGLALTQYFARSYAEEAGVLAKLAEELPGLDLLISFNGKAFDWPFVRDRMAYHRIQCRAAIPHLDLLHPSRRRWRSQLPNCKLQTLERYLSGRWRSGDIPSEQIPQRYHDYVREQDARLIAPIFHHNRMDLITMVELLIALVGRS